MIYNFGIQHIIGNMYIWEFHRRNMIVLEVMQKSRKGGMMGP
jgi:hypothetical protein